ncbi:MAG TPA: methyltransferase domain-containing protein [Bryobacteraceae bacterium]|nr:methyltransferase domain-containing protein [Bryobacteraceae bacterium]
MSELKIQRLKLRSQKYGAVFCAVLLFSVTAEAQVAKEANSQYQTPDGRKAVAAGLSAPDRDDRQKPRELVKSMGITRGMSVADVGTGIGYMLPFLSRGVGPMGRVFAEDIFEDYLETAKMTAESQHLNNIVFIKGTDKDPKLPGNSLDRVLILDVYHHFDYPEAMLAGIHKALKDEGRLVIVEYYKNESAMPNGRALTHIRLNKPDVIEEVEANHFHLVSESEQIPNVQYMLVLEKR